MFRECFGVARALVLEFCTTLPSSRSAWSCKGSNSYRLGFIQLFAFRSYYETLRYNLIVSSKPHGPQSMHSRSSNFNSAQCVHHTPCSGT